MDTPSASMRDLARRLLAVEAARPNPGDARVPVAGRVCEKLRISLTRFAGSDGFASLLRRAIALARAEVPSLHGITINPGCSIEELERLAADAGDGDPAAAVIAHLLGLLETFIGEPLTRRLVRDAWPDESLDE